MRTATATLFFLLLCDGLSGCDTAQSPSDDEGAVDRLAPGVACGRDAPPLEVPLRVLPSGVVPHWSTSAGCVTVSYAPDFAEQIEPLRAAMSGWTLDCSTLCFDGPVERAEAPEAGAGERRLHVAWGPADVVNIEAEAFYDIDRGTIAQALVRVPPDASPTVDDLLWAVGRASGLGNPAGDVPSVMGTPDASRVAPTEADAATFCVLYGDPPLCP